MAKLNGKVAVVTGASLGIGAAIAEKLAEEGAAVAVNYSRNKDAAEKLSARIKERGGKAIAVQADIRDQAQVKRLFAETKSALGAPNVLVNNAGVYEFKPLGDITEEHIDQHFSLNVKGLVLATQEFVKGVENGSGVIVNISSVVAQTPPAGGSVYSATKGAVDTLTKSWAAELGSKGIRVNSVAPGATVTEGFREMAESDGVEKLAVSRTPLGRLGKPEDIASVVTFLATDEAGWITGQVVPVSGGLTL